MTPPTTANYVRALAAKHGIRLQNVLLELWATNAANPDSALDDTQSLLLVLGRRKLISKAELDRLNSKHLAEKFSSET